MSSIHVQSDTAEPPAGDFCTKLKTNMDDKKHMLKDYIEMMTKQDHTGETLHFNA